MLKTAHDDALAFRRLYERYKRPVMSYLRQLVRTESLAEELTQETFLRVYRARKEYQRGQARFTTWLFSIARNAGIDHLRKKGELLIEDRAVAADEAEEAQIEKIESPLESAEEQLIRHADQKRLEHCLGELSLPQREALTLRTVSELAYDEIARTLGTSLASVKSLLFRAKEALIRCLARQAEGGEPCP